MFCLLHRFIISHSADVGKPVTGKTKKHLENCEACRHFYNVTNYLEKTLPSESKLATKGFHPETEEIMQSIPEIKFNPDPLTSKIKLLAIAAGLIFAFLLSTYFIPSNQDEEKNNYKDVISEFSGIVKPDNGFALSGIMQNPIQAELNNIVGDMKSVAKFLFTCVNINIDSTGKIEGNSEVGLNTDE